MPEQDGIEFDDVSVEELTEYSGTGTSGTFATGGSLSTPLGCIGTVGTVACG